MRALLVLLAHLGSGASPSPALPADLGLYTVVTCNATSYELDAAAEAKHWLTQLSGRNTTASAASRRLASLALPPARRPLSLQSY